jgi:hypothetical protein
MRTFAEKTGKAGDEQKRDQSAFRHVDNRPGTAQMRQPQLADNRPAPPKAAETSQVIQGVFIQDHVTSLWCDSDTNKVYQQTSTMSGGRVTLTAQDGETIVIERDTNGTWNRVSQQAHFSLIPQRDSGYRVDAKFENFEAVDELKKKGELKKDDLPYRAHGELKDHEVRDFYSDFPTLKKGEQPSEGYNQLLGDRIRAYSKLAQPAPPEEGFNKRPFKASEKYDYSVDASGGLPFHQADDLIKSSYQRKDKAEERLTPQDLYEAQYLQHFNRIVPDSPLYAPFTQTQHSGHWLNTLGPTLDVNFPPAIPDKSAGTDYKAVHSVFKHFVEALSANPDFLQKTAEDTQLFLDARLAAAATAAHKDAYLGSSNKTKSKTARGEGGKAKKRTTLTTPERKNIDQAHALVLAFIAGEDVTFPASKMARNVQKIAYLFYIKLVKRAITNVIILMHSSDRDIRQGVEHTLNSLFGKFARLAALQSKLYTGTSDETEESSDEEEYQPSLPIEVQLLADRNGVQARYGGSHGNNCLIYAVGGALGVDLSDQAAAVIRAWLNNHSAQRGHFSAHGQLPMLPGLIQEITNQLMQGGHNVNGNVTVVTTQGNYSAQGAVANNANNGNVLVILHGGHYYFTQAAPAQED